MKLVRRIMKMINWWVAQEHNLLFKEQNDGHKTWYTPHTHTHHLCSLPSSVSMWILIENVWEKKVQQEKMDEWVINWELALWPFCSQKITLSVASLVHLPQKLASLPNNRLWCSESNTLLGLLSGKAEPGFCSQSVD